MYFPLPKICTFFAKVGICIPSPVACRPCGDGRPVVTGCPYRSRVGSFPSGHNKDTPDVHPWGCRRGVPSGLASVSGMHARRVVRGGIVRPVVTGCRSVSSLCRGVRCSVGHACPVVAIRSSSFVVRTRRGCPSRLDMIKRGSSVRVPDVTKICFYFCSVSVAVTRGGC